MTHLPNKKPTDAKIIRSLTAFEEAYNVFIAAINTIGRENHPRDEDAGAMYKALKVARGYATDAYNRKSGE